MLLAIDIGNTNIVLGLYQGKKLVTHWRLATQAERTADEYGVIISQLIDYSGHRSQQISAIAVSCVVPPMALIASVTMLSPEMAIINGRPGPARSISVDGRQKTSAHARPIESSVNRPTNKTSAPSQ